MNANACKWFRLARLIDPTRKAPYLGEAISALKLSKVKHAIKVLRSRPGLPAHERKKKMAAAAEPDEPFDMLIDSEELEEEDEQNLALIDSDLEPDRSLANDGLDIIEVKKETSRTDKNKESQPSADKDPAGDDDLDNPENTTTGLEQEKVDIENQFQFL